MVGISGSIQESLTKDVRVTLDRHLVSLVGKVPVYHARSSGSISSRTKTQGIIIIEEKVLPLL